MPKNDRDDRRSRDRDDDRRGSSRGRDDRDDDRGSRGRNRDDDDRGGKGGGTRYTYRARSAEEVNRRANQSSGRYDSYLTEDVTWYKSHQGENQIRIIGWLNGSDPDYDALADRWGTHWGIDIIIHRNVGVDGGTYLCLDKMAGKPCEMCDAYRDDEEALKPSDRVLCWLIDRKNEKAGPQLWAMPLGTSKDFSAVSKVRGRGADAGAAVMIDDPNEGYDLFFDREGEKARTRYVRPELDREASPLHENQRKQDEWLDYVADHRLPDLLKVYPADHIAKVLSGQVSRREENDTEDRGSRRGGRDDRDDSRSSRRGRGRDAEEDTDTDRASSRRRGRDDDPPEDDADFSRSSRRGRGRDAEDKEDKEDKEDDAPGKGASDDRDAADDRSTRRGRGRDVEDDPPPRESRRGRGRDDDPPNEDDPPARGKTERYRSGDKKDKDPPDDDVDAARERLSGVGRRRR